MGIRVWFAPSEDQLQIEEDLITIRNRVTNWRQFDLLYQRAYRLMRHKKRHAMIRNVISSLKLKILALERIDIEHEINLENPDQWMTLLSQGLADLYGLKGRAMHQVEIQQETEAIEKDRAELNQALRQIRAQPSPLPLQRKKISLYRMEDPLSEPLVLELQWRRYCELIWYITHAKIVPKPDLWIRRDNKHSLTPTGRIWMYANGRDEIQDMNLDVVNREVTTNYIVALVHENEQDIPVPIDICQHGGDPCCPPNPCINLRNHLEKVWTSRVVVNAHLISDPEKNSVLSDLIDTSLWTPRTNDLFIVCEPRQA